MDFIETKIPGCFEIYPKIFKDHRGLFIKTFQREAFREHGLTISFAEEFFSVSKHKVLRGMHFQLPPHAHAKLIYCITGKIFDVLVDLRLGSPVYGQPMIFNLSAEKANILYVPVGVAHGFYTLSETATVVYKTSTVHIPECDAGILWKSFAIWPDLHPILSPRDKQHPLLETFVSPFYL